MLSTDSCSRLVAGNYDVLVNETSDIKSIITNFLHRFKRHELNSDQADRSDYANEFKKLKELSKTLKEDKDNIEIGELEVNVQKNRYKDILPFNHTRVVLSKSQQPGSDYINANYVRGPSVSPRTYIACQGPLPSTLIDFWRMIWECNVSVIVMACNEYESGERKCEPYWPEQMETSQYYGNIQVTLVKVRQICSDFLIRKFSVKLMQTPRNQQQQQQQVIFNNDKLHCNNNNIHDSSNHNFSNNHQNGHSIPNVDSNGFVREVIMERTICQFHYTTWPDHGVPGAVEPILELVRLIRDVQPAEDKPILVHCSAGCGRTGTICCIDYVWGSLRSGKLDPDFDLCRIIGEMRHQRMAMVQTLEQYILCHRAVAALFINQLDLIDKHAYENMDADDDDVFYDETAYDEQDHGPVFI